MRGFKEIVLKDRCLKKGDECEYHASIVNGTGSTWASCVVSEVLNPELKRYRLAGVDGLPREWTVQDIDERVMAGRIGKDLVSLSWIKTRDEK